MVSAVSEERRSFSLRFGNGLMGRSGYIGDIVSEELCVSGGEGGEYCCVPVCRFVSKCRSCRYP